MKFKVEKEIFEKWPKLVEAVVIIDGFDNTRSGEEILKLLRNEETKKREELKDKDLSKLPQFSPWGKAYQEFGADPKRYFSSVWTLTKRVVEGEKIPDISPMVNLCNFVSLKHLLNLGEENLEGVYGDEVLKFCEETEEFIPMGSTKIKHPQKGEVAWVDDRGVTCRRWNWRQNERTKITPATIKGYFIMDGLPPVGREEIRKAVSEFISLCEKFLGGKGKIYWLTKGNPEVKVPFKSKKWVGKAKIPEVKMKVEIKKITDNLVDKKSIAWKLQELVWQAARKFDQSLKVEDIHLEHPENPEHGDYATNVAMILFGKTRSKRHLRGVSPRLKAGEPLHLGGGEIKKPLDLAKLIVKNLPKADFLEKVEAAKPGFINFWLSKEWSMTSIIQIIKEKEKFGTSQAGKGKKIVLEHTSPNIIKTLHIGHVRNNVLGMAVGRILKFLGFEVILDCINNDRGIAVMKAVWAYLRHGLRDKRLRVKDKTWKEALDIWFKNQDRWSTPQDENLKPDHFVDKFYVLGVKDEAKYKDEMQEMLRDWENDDPKVLALWKRLTGWVHQGFAQTYKRLGSHHDKNWYESKLYREGKEIVLKGVKKGVFETLADGAILTNLEKYGLPNKIVMRSDGTALYETFDLALTKRKQEEFEADLYIWVIGPEQTLYLKQLYAMCEQLGIGRQEDYFHLSYGFVYLKGKGKMSSRAGTVVLADWLMEELHRRAKKIIEGSDPQLRGKISEKEKEAIAETVGLAALKYGMLKFSRTTDIQFDISESLSLEGDSGPYLQYTYARCKSVLRKAKEDKTIPDRQAIPFPERTRFTPWVNREELAILRTIYKFSEVVWEAGENYAPNLICNFLFDLAQKFNTFYNKWPILKPEKDTSKVSADFTLEVKESELGRIRAFRLALTAATAQLLKNGLELLGIKTLERM